MPRILSHSTYNLSRKLIKIVLSALLAVVFNSSIGQAEQVVLPLTLDYNLLTSLLVREAFPGKGNSAAIVGRPGDCEYLGISDPKYSMYGNNVKLEMRLNIRLGADLGIGGRCLSPLEWRGYIVLVQQPVFDSQNFSLSFRTIDSAVLNQAHQPANIASVLWEFAKPRVYEHLNRVRLNLAPPIHDMQEFLGPLFHAQARRATQNMLDSLRGGDISVNMDGVEAELIGQVDEVYKPDPNESTKTIGPEQKKQLVKLWETWDVFLVSLISLLATEPLTPEDQQLLSAVLLDTRYAFTAALEEEEMEKDFVRMQFLRAWRDLAPLFRRQLYSRPSPNTLGYLAFFTAADALVAFDKMGPTLGIEISQQGLVRLAGMLTGKESPLQYNLDIDPVLRKLFQLPAINIQKPSGPEEEIEEIDIPPTKDDEDPLSSLARFFVAPAYALDKPEIAEALKWRVPEDDLMGHVERVRAMLDEVSGSVMTRLQLPAQYQEMFKSMITAMAWQESCFRQFIEKNKKLTFLLSYNNTSVGMMQINERVWRGMYDHNQLRWDVRYNVQAGCEIADLYLRRYALQGKGAASGNLKKLPGIVYAMYNGGPGQYDKYLARDKAGKPLDSDKLYAEKLQWVDKNAWDRIKNCLGGE